MQNSNGLWPVIAPILSVLSLSLSACGADEDVHWPAGAGGNAWNAMTYDPEFDTLYIGTGNGAPWNRKVRSPGGGDNLFLCSIVAIDAKTGAYRWHYQINPGESWDYNAAMDIQLATLTIEGRPRKVLMQAPKNGFFYVIDRQTGKLISADKFSKATWASRIDLASGRPVEAPDARYPHGETLIWPGTNDAHNWQAMSFHPNTGLVYIPVLEMPGYYADKTIDVRTWKPPASKWVFNSGLDPVSGADVPTDIARSELVAWDPVAKKARGRVAQPGFCNGGTLATAGGLVFQGQANGRLSAYSADHGTTLWSFDAQTGIIGAPISYRLGGRQFVVVIAGYGGTGAMFGNLSRKQGWDVTQRRRILAFPLDGKAQLPPKPAAAEMHVPPGDPTYRPDPARAARGNRLYHVSCFICHGIAGVAAGRRRTSATPRSCKIVRHSTASCWAARLNPRGCRSFRISTRRTPRTSGNTSASVRSIRDPAAPGEREGPKRTGASTRFGPVRCPPFLDSSRVR